MVGGIFGKKDEGKAEQPSQENRDGKDGLAFAKDVYTADALRNFGVWDLLPDRVGLDEHGRSVHRLMRDGRQVKFFLYDGLWYCVDNGTTQKPPRDQIPVDPHPAYIEADAAALQALLADAAAKLNGLQAASATRFARIADDLPAFVQARREVIAALAGEAHAALIARQFDEVADVVLRAMDDLRATVEEAGAATTAVQAAADRA